MEFKGTKGEWSSCNCKWVLSEGHCGSIATVNYSLEGEHWSEGDNPILEESKYNSLLISKAPEMLEMLIELAFICNLSDEKQREVNKLIKEVTELPE